ncbi:hypothetical protein ML401_33840 [Bradyrhizobium sp. 62B]|uniref:hypothetical protein n=1 Tax=Bradyrhizobium sp. 62B TaxID=2898442 RepID=UPI00255837C5|nr:hypothetical protein ML401_33840 [Bradyrhizobium sp. 62B]
MATVGHGARAPARWQPIACGLVLLASCLLAASAGAFVSNLPPLFSPALTLDPAAKLPAPARYSFRGTHTTVMPGIEAPLRTRLETTVPAQLGDVVSFYRTELGKLGWREKPEGAVIAADHVQLTFASPLGPAALQLARKDGSTSIHIVQKNADAASRANIMPEPGKAMLVFSNISGTDATLTIDAKTVKRAAGTNAVSLDLAPGRYSYELRVPDRSATTKTLDIVAGDTWELTVGPDGDVWPPLQLY